MKLIFILFFLSFSLIACQKKDSFRYKEWQQGQPESAKTNLLSVNTEKNLNPVKYKNKSIQISRQIYNGKPVYNSFLKTVSTDNSIELIQSHFIDENDIKAAIKKEEFKNIDYAVELKKESPLFNKIEIINTKDVVAIEANKPINYILVNFFDRLGTPYEALFKANGNLARLSRTGSQFSDVNTTLYADGPKLSPLSDLVLKSVSADPALSNTFISVTSESENKISKLSPILKFDPKDDRFDQMQVFYYLNKSFQWMKENLQVQIPQRIDAVVHMGYPEKTNSAFYFQGKIRIGAGDDITYSHIAQDASIIYHESFHALIDNVAGLPYEGEGGSLNEGFADFFTCLMTDRPYLVESSYLKGAFKRNLNNGFKLSEKNGGLYHDSLIISSTLWEIKEKLGSEKAKLLAIETLIRLNSVSILEDFSKKLNEVAHQNLNVDDQAIIVNVLNTKGFTHE